MPATEPTSAKMLVVGCWGIEASPLSPADSAASLEALVDSVRAARRAWRIVLIIDSGFGNVGRDGLEVIPGKEVPDVGALPDFGPGVIVWLAESGAGGALAYPSAQHGLFTYLVLGSTRGWADGVLYDDPDGQVSLLEAQTYVDQVAQRLGRVTHPAIDLRAEENNWPLVQGSNLEAGPDFATARRLSLEDRQNRFAAREEMIKAEASAFWAETLQLVQEGGPDGQIALEGFIAEYERARIEIEWAVSLPELERAREMLIHYSDSSSDMVSMSASDILPSCDDLISLEQSAFVGEFSEPQITCLENRMRTERLQTVRSDISRLLLVNAQSAGNVPVWEELMARHLEEIDRSDPDLCFSYAVHLYRSSLDNQEESIRWSNYALENKHVWEGEAFIKNVSNLYKLRAEAASKLWQDAEKQHIASPSSESTALARDFRGLAMDYSREWLDYMRAASLPEERAYNMCVAAAGTADFCQSQ